ncbi:MAG: sulfur carrier protein ThiS [Peptostreptococcaceae bacterium]
MIVNGKEMEKDNLTNLSSLLEKLNIKEDRVVVELNKNIIDKSQFSTTNLEHSDILEIIAFVGGG